MDEDGNHVWSSAFNGTSTPVATAMSVAPNGDVVIAGRFTGTINFGAQDLVAGTNYRFYVVRIAAGGGLVWSTSFTMSDAQSQLEVLTFDSFGNIYAAGYFAGSVNFGGNSFSSNAHDAFLFKLTSSGAHVWSKAFGGIGDQYTTGVEWDSVANQLIIGGSFENSIDFGGNSLSGGAYPEAYLAGFEGDGNYLWSQGFAIANMTAIDSTSYGVISAGGFSGTIDLGAGEIVASGGDDAYLGSFGSTGTNQWIKGFGSSATEYFHNLAVDPEDEPIAIAGSTAPIDFGGGDVPPSGLMIAKFDAAGNHRWSRSIASGAAKAVSIVGDGSIVLAGEFLGTIDFGGSTLNAAGGGDIFVAKLGP